MQISILSDAASNWYSLPASGIQGNEGEFDQTMSQVIAMLKHLPPGLTRNCSGKGNPQADAPSRLNLPGQAFLTGILAELATVKKQEACSEGSQQAGDDTKIDTGQIQDPFADLTADPALLQNVLNLISFIEKETGIEPDNLTVKAMINGSGQIQVKARTTRGAVPVEVQTPPEGSAQPDENTSGASTAEDGQPIFLARPLVKMLERNRTEMTKETLPKNMLEEAQPDKNSGALAAETAKNIKQKENAAGAGKTISPAESIPVESGSGQPQVKTQVQPGARLGEVETPPAGPKPGEKANSGKNSVSGYFRTAGENEKMHVRGAYAGKSGILPPGIAKRFATAVKDGSPAPLPGSEGKPPVQSASPLQNSMGSEPPPAGRVTLTDLPGRLIQEIKNVVNTRKDKLQTEVELKLEPEHLGKLMVKLFINKGTLSVHFFTGNSNVKEALEASMQQLKESFVQHDLKLNEAFVFVGDGNRGNAGGHFERGNSNLAFHGFYNRQAAGDYLRETLDSFSPETASSGVNCLV
ncbi:MAG: flagellar hook-length control protein FliK [Eubacteriales bacterium]